MTRIIVLDTGPLGLITNPRRSVQSEQCNQWLQRCLYRSDVIVVPEIADYELRRELLRAGKTAGLARLDALGAALHYLPLDTETMRLAAELWAQLRQVGQPTADKHALDGDVILAAQAQSLRSEHVVVATTNVGHLSRLTRAKLWHTIWDVGGEA